MICLPYLPWLGWDRKVLLEMEKQRVEGLLRSFILAIPTYLY